MGYFVTISWLMILIAVIAFLCEFMDSSLGMGYGTTLTPVLLLFGFEPAQIVPVILISEFIAALVSVGFHALFKNMKLRHEKSPKARGELSGESLEGNLDREIQTNGGRVVSNKKEGFIFKLKNLTEDSKVVLVLTIFGVFGVIIAAILTTIFSYSDIVKLIIKLYIGTMVFAMGIIIVALINKKIKFSFKKIFILGGIAGFNKGISGGGYGPIIVPGQILSGREGKNAIASTAFAEGIVCFVGVFTYIITNIVRSRSLGESLNLGDFSLAPYLIIGAILSAPLAALITKKLSSKWLKVSVGVATIILGIITLIRTILNFTGIW